MYLRIVDFLSTVFRVLEHFHKYCSHSAKIHLRSGLFGFWLRFGSVTGFLEPAPSPKPRQNTKNPRSECLQYFFKRSSRKIGHRWFPVAFMEKKGALFFATAVATNAVH